MKIRNVSPLELCDKAGLTDKSLRNYRKGIQYPSLHNLVALAKALSPLTVEQLENPEAFSDLMFQLAVKFDELTFEQVCAVLSEADNYLLKFVRSLSLKDYDVIKRGYADLLTGELERKGLDIAGFLNRIHKAKFIQRMLDTLPTEPPLVIAVESNFERVDFKHKDRVVLPVPDAELLWDCCCPGRGEKSPDCKIHSHPMAGLVSKLFRNGLVQIEWRGLKFLWRWSPVLWPPSVDAFFLMSCLESRGLTKADVSSVLDIGSGTGFLGIALAKLNPAVRTVVLSDWLLTPALFGQLNWRINAPQTNAATVTSRVSMHTDPPDAPFDLVVCNPPYLPKLAGCEDIGLESTVFGTDLLEHVIQNAKALGKRVLVQYSQIAHDQAKRAANAVGAMLDLVDSKQNVPFRVPHALDHLKYIESLIAERHLKRSKCKGHRYLHELRTYEVI